MVKCATINKYLSAAAKFVQLVGQRRECPMQDPHTKKWCKKIDQHLKDFKCWEIMPTRQDPLTKKIIRDLQHHAKALHQDSKEVAFINWCIIGLHMGYRCCNWASNLSTENPDDIHCVSPMNDRIYQCVLVLDKFKLLGREGERIADPKNYPPDKLGGTIHCVH
jgi:hypothetical protein